MPNKKIAVVTWIGSGNFGTTLQSYSLLHFLNKQGYNAFFLQAFKQPFGIKERIFDILYKLRINRLLDNIKPLPLNIKKLHRFINKNYSIIRVFSDRQYNRLLDDTDVFCTGSDQIWNTKFAFNPFYFLGFGEDIKRIAYASSMGIKDFPEEHKEKVKSLLSRFNHIGVREETAKEAISTLLDSKEVYQVLDPTFLLDQNDWQGVSNQAIFEVELPKKYIACYLIGNNRSYADQIQKVKASTGIDSVVIIPSKENSGMSIPGATIYSDAGPSEFINLLQNASFVCTDSFHATALSINMRKDFVEFLRFADSDKASQNSRIYDVLSHYGLMNRIFSNSEYSWSLPIEYDSVHEILNEDRKKSIDYLINAIEN